MAEYRFTEYFETEVLRKRPYLKKEWCTRVVEQPLRSEPQEHNRFRFWAMVPEFGDRVLRVVTLEDKLNDSQCVSRSRLQAMKVNYHPETDSLYIDLSEATSVESRQVSEGVVLDYDAAGNLVGIDIDNASRKVQLQRFTVSKLPAAVETLAG